MKQHLRSLWTLLLLMMWCSVGFAQETLTGSWDLTKKSTDWNGTGYEKYFTQPYGYKKANGTLVNKSIADFSTAGITQIKVGFKCLQNGGNTSKITIYLVNAKGEALGTGIEVTPTNATAASKTVYSYATFTSNLEEATGFMMKVTKRIDKNILINGASYEVTYNASTKTKTTLTFPKTAISINGGDEASFKGQSAKLYAGKQELTDKTIKYAHTGNDIFATFDETTGAATLKSGVYGTATVTATYVGDDTYEEAKASYTVKIVDPNASEVTFDFSKPGDYDFEVPTSGNGVNIEGKSIVSGIVSLTVKHDGDTKSRFWNSNGVITYRLYDGTINTVSVPEGYVITAIAVTAADKKKLITIGENTDNSDWTGSAQAVDITGTGKAVLTSMTVTYSKVATTTSLPLNETTTAEDAKTLLEANQDKTVNVTINRTLVANKWNTLCLPFDVTAEQIKNILKAEGMVREYKDQTADCIYFQAAETMTAGVPYLIKPTEEVKGLTFEGVKITATEGVAKGAETGSIGENLSICGVLGAKALSTDGSELFLNADGKFVAPAKGKETMKGFRAYFMSLLGAEAKINIDGETTGINSIETEATVNGKVYNLNGQYVGNSLNGLKKGIYVVNGKKVIK